MNERFRLTNFNFPILIINLERAQHRWTNVVENFEKAEITNYERIIGVDGFKIEESKEDLAKLAPGVLEKLKLSYRHAHSDLSYGSVGCFLSHMKCWQRIVDSNSEYGLICEDDIFLPINFKERFLLAMEEVPSDWDFLNLGHSWFYKRNLIEEKIQMKYNVFNRVRGAWGLSCYLIKRSFCQLLLQKALPLKVQVDTFIYYFHTEKNMYCIKDAISGISAKVGKSLIDHPPVKNEIKGTEIKTQVSNSNSAVIVGSIAGIFGGLLVLFIGAGAVSNIVQRKKEKGQSISVTQTFNQQKTIFN